jgi:hypothetical protein
MDDLHVRHGATLAPFTHRGVYVEEAVGTAWNFTANLSSDLLGDLSELIDLQWHASVFLLVNKKARKAWSGDHAPNPEPENLSFR